MENGARIVSSSVDIVEVEKDRQRYSLRAANIYNKKNANVLLPAYQQLTNQGKRYIRNEATPAIEPKYWPQ